VRLPLRRGAVAPGKVRAIHPTSGLDTARATKVLRRPDCVPVTWPAVDAPTPSRDQLTAATAARAVSSHSDANARESPCRAVFPCWKAPMNNRSAENARRVGNDIEDPTFVLAAQGRDMAAVIKTRARKPTVFRDPDQLERNNSSWPRDGIVAHLDIEAAMARLTPVHRDALVGWFYAAITYADFAAWPGTELSTGKTRLLRGKEQLKPLLLEPNTASAVSNPAMPGTAPHLGQP
jgi:hypothetical protein